MASSVSVCQSVNLPQLLPYLTNFNPVYHTGYSTLFIRTNKYYNEIQALNKLWWYLAISERQGKCRFKETWLKRSLRGKHSRIPQMEDHTSWREFILLSYYQPTVRFCLVMDQQPNSPTLRYPTARQSDGSIVWQLDSSTVRLSDSSTVRQFHSPTVP